MSLLLGRQRYSNVQQKAKSRLVKKAALLITCVGLVGFFCLTIVKNFSVINTKETLDEQTPITMLDTVFDNNHQIFDELKPGETLFGALKRLKLTDEEANSFVKSIGTKTNLKKLGSKTKLSIATFTDNSLLFASENKVKSVEVFMKDEKGIIYTIKAERIMDTSEQTNSSTIKVSLEKPDVFKKSSMLAGVVNSSLYASMIASGADASLVNNFSDIFGWQIDFYREAKKGDYFKMVVEKNYIEGRFVGYGSVIAAEYITGLKKLRGFRFDSTDGKVVGFFDEKGQSLKNAFLKTPLKLASIGSKFGMRFHPVLKTYRPHNGVDYGAKTGTPFMAVASGVVIEAGFSKFNGNWARIRHMNGYDTEYLHASRLAKGIYKGAKVTQGQVVGYVGSTGLATGPHLHFGMRKNGSYINPAKQIFDRNPGVPKSHMNEFLASVNPVMIAFNQHQIGEPAVLAQTENNNNNNLVR